VVLQNLVGYRPQLRPTKPLENASSDSIPVFCQNLHKTKINEIVLMSQLRIMGSLVSIFQYDPESKQELTALNLEISRQVEDLLTSLNADY